MNSSVAMDTPRPRRGFWTRGRREGLTGWLLVGPMMLYYGIMGLVPIGAVVAISFTKWNGIQGSPVWVGLKNYRYIWNYQQSVFTTTFVIAALLMALGIPLAFVLALLLNTKVRGRGVYRTLFYLPVVVSQAIVVQMFSSFLDPTNGIFDRIVTSAGHSPIYWSLSGFWMTFWIVVMTTWQGVGNSMILFLAGLQGIDVSLYEAARIDGAGNLTIFYRMTLPLLRPVTTFVLITSAVWDLQILIPVQLLTQGGPLGATNVVVWSIYKDAFLNSRFGNACATSVVLALICMVLTVISLRTVGRSAVE